MFYVIDFTIPCFSSISGVFSALLITQLFMTDLEERVLEDIELQPHMWCRYIDDICFYQGA